MVSFYSWRINQLFMLMKLLGGMTGEAGCLSWRDLLTSEKVSSFFLPSTPTCMLFGVCFGKNVWLGQENPQGLHPWLDVTLLSLPFSPYEALPGENHPISFLDFDDSSILILEFWSSQCTWHHSRHLCIQHLKSMPKYFLITSCNRIHYAESSVLPCKYNRCKNSTMILLPSLYNAKSN